MNEHHEDQDMITLLQTTQSTLTSDARRRIWKNALQAIPPRREWQWVGRLPFALAALGLVLFAFVLTLRPLLNTPMLAATATVTATPIAQSKDGITSHYMVLHTTRGDIQDYTFIWYQAPDLFRSETYSTEYSPVPVRESLSVMFRNALLKNQLAKLPAEVSPEKYRLSGISLMDKERYWNLYHDDVALFGLELDKPAFRTYRLMREEVTGRGQDALMALLQRYTTNSGTAKLIGEETLLGRKAWIIDGYDTFGYLTFSRHQRMWIDQESLFRLKTISYDEKSGQTTDTMETIQLEINPVIPASTFRLDIPAEAWRDAFKKRNYPDSFNTSLWGFYLPSLPFTIYTVGLGDPGIAEKLLFTPPEYDPLQNKVLAQAFSSDDPFGKPAVRIEESPATNALAVRSSTGNTYTAPANAMLNGEGAIHVVDGNRIFDWVTYGTRVRITARVSVLTEAEFQTLVGSLLYIPPRVDATTYIAMWKNIALMSNFKVFAPGYDQWVKFDEAGRVIQSSLGSPIEFTNLVAGVPVLSGVTGIMQPFYLSTKPGIVAAMTEGKFSEDYSTWEKDDTFSDNEEAWYKVEGERHYLVVIKDGTTIRIEAQLADVTRETLHRLWFYMRPVPVPDTK